MSTASGGKAGGGAGGYEVSRPQGRCSACSGSIPPDGKFMAALMEVPGAFERADYCSECWSKADRKDVVAFWQAVMPRPEQKKRLFVDDAVLCELFERLAEVTEPAKLSFRFVLGLILMRKRLVIYEGTRIEDGKELWRMRLRGRQDLLDLLNPRLDEGQIKQVTEQLGEILQQEL